MTKYCIIPLLSVLSFSTSFATPYPSTVPSVARPNLTLRGPANFTVERDLELQENSIKVIDQTDFKITDEAGKKVYRRPNYKLTTEAKGNTFRVVEVSVAENENKTNWIRMIELENGEPKSFTRCDAGTMSEEDLSAAQTVAGANNFVLEGCATATPKVCQTFAKYFGSSKVAQEQIQACESIKKVGEELQNAMGSDEYKLAKKANTTDMSDAFVSLMQPKVLDGQKVKNSVKAPSAASLKDADNLLSLAKACSDFDNMSFTQNFAKKDVKNMEYKRIKASRLSTTNPPALREVPKAAPAPATK